jgi:translocation and assembly module TamB
MRRRILLVVGGALLALVLAGAAFGAALLATAPGRDALRRYAVRVLQDQIDGSVSIGAIGGSLWRTVEARDVLLATRDGRPAIRVGRLRVGFALSDLVRKRFVFRSVELVRPTLVLEQGADGRWNVEHLFKLLEPKHGPPGSRPLVDLWGVRLRDGTLILRQRAGGGRVRERTVLGLDLDLARLRASHPDSAAIVAEVDRLAGRLSDPALVVTKADGDVALEGDSLRFDLDHFELPGTRAALAGRVRWGGARTALDLSVNARRFSFADLAGAAPTLPRTGGGRLALRARLLESGAAEYDVREFAIETGRTAASGRVRVTTGERGGLSIRAMDVALVPLDFAVLAPFVDSLPVRGLVRGRVRGAGALADLAVDADLAFTDEAVEGRPTNVVIGRGRLGLGGQEQLVFHRLVLQRGEFDLGTVRRFAPVVSLLGRIAAAGTLTGPWRNATFEGTLRHLMPAEPALPVSIVRGTVHLALADTVRIDADVTADSLSFDLLARSYPAIPLKGMVAGPVHVHGPARALELDASLAGPAGAFAGRGAVGAGDSVVTVRGAGTVQGVDAHAHVAAAPPTVLSGAWAAELTVPLADAGAPTTGTVSVALADSRVAGVMVRRAGFAVALSRERIALDSAYLDAPAGVAMVSGALGRAGRPLGQVGFTLRVDALAELAPLMRWMRGAAGDTTTAPALGGAGRLAGRLVGTVTDWDAEGTLDVDSLRFGADEVRGARVRGRLARGHGPLTIGVAAAADSLVVSGLAYARVSATLAGPADSLAVHAAAAFGPGGALRVAGLVAGDSLARRLRLDTLTLALAASTWELVQPARAVLTPDSVLLDSVELRSEGGGRIRAQGSLPRAGVGDFVLAADSVPLADAYALAELDTAGIGGTADLALRLAGAAASPTLELRLGLTDARFGSYHAPALMVLGSYSDRRLSFKGGLWRDSVRVLSLAGSLPLDLALTGVERRRLPGPIAISARSDSVEMEPLGALTDLVTDVGGLLNADVRIGGTWDQPQLSGFLETRRGAFRIPALGARYTDADLRLDLAGDEIRVTRGRVRGGSGTLDIGGVVRLESLSRPVLDLALGAHGFHAFDIRDFASLTGTGDLTLRGPAIGATLSGRLTVDHGSLAFADLVEKRIVNLDDPEFRAIVDSNLARARALAPDVQTVLLDSLLISGLTVAMGPDVWLRSTEANIQLDGEFRVAKSVEEGLARYRLDGTLRAVRGNYRLVLAATSKEFRVTRGTVRFFGTPDFDPELDIAAEHPVRTLDGGQLVVRALIGGTLLAPRLALESDQRPPLSETEIVSYLLFGRPSFDLVAAGSGSRNELAILQSTLMGYAAGELGQGLVSTLGLPLDYLAIRPGAATQGDPFGFSSTRLEAGTQIGDRTFVTLNAGLCEVRTSQLVGASVEYRLNPRWTVEASLEPLVALCRAGLFPGSQTSTTAKYQIGVDLFWQTGNR